MQSHVQPFPETGQRQYGVLAPAPAWAPSRPLAAGRAATAAAFSDAGALPEGRGDHAHPVLILDPDGRILSANPAARRMLAHAARFRVSEDVLAPARPVDRREWERLLGRAKASAGRPALAFLAGTSAIVVARVGPPALHFRVVFGREAVCSPRLLAWVAQALALTAAESAVLALLVDGFVPCTIAQERGVSEATVRSQIRSILSKSGDSSVRHLIIRLARLPSPEAVEGMADTAD